MKRFYKTNEKSTLISMILIFLSMFGFADNLSVTHFATVWNGENGQNHMNLMVVSAILEDLPLSVDDEIAVFSGVNCVGAMKLTKSVNPADNTTFLNIPASQADGLNNGFTENDTIIFKIWDNLNQKEMVAKAVTYRNNVATWQTNGRYAVGATSVVDLIFYVELAQSINLIKGYNMISTNVSAKNPNISAITKTLLTQGNLVKMMDEAGLSYENWGAFGGWINNIGSIVKTEGYKVKVANTCTLQIVGRPVVLPLAIPLSVGWNIVSYPRTDLVSALSIVQALIDQNKLIKVQDEAGNSIENWGVFGGWKNNIGNFTPGKAYKVKVNAAATLTIENIYLKSAIVQSKVGKTDYYSTKIEGNGSDQMNINIVGLQTAGLSVGDEIAAFDGKICVGVLKITEDHINAGASLIASFSTDDLNQYGFKDGDLIQLKAWNHLSGSESVVQVETVSGQMNYEKSASVLVKIKSVTTGIKDLNDLVKIDVFPNPSSGIVNVRFSQMPAAGSRIDILDLRGKKVASRVISRSSEVFNLDGVSKGIYLVKTIMGSSESIQKLIVE